MENIKGIKNNVFEEIVIELRISNELLQKIYTNVRLIATQGANPISLKPQLKIEPTDDSQKIIVDDINQSK